MNDNEPLRFAKVAARRLARLSHLSAALAVELDPRFNVVACDRAEAPRIVDELAWRDVVAADKKGQLLAVRSTRHWYIGYWGPNRKDYGYPEMPDDDEHKWRSAGDISVGQPLPFDPIEVATPTDSVLNRLDFM